MNLVAVAYKQCCTNDVVCFTVLTCVPTSHWTLDEAYICRNACSKK